MKSPLGSLNRWWTAFRTPRGGRKSPAARWSERFIESTLALAAASSIGVTTAIAGVLVFESASFFGRVSLFTFLTDTVWAPMFASPRYGILPLAAGTIVTTVVALFVCVPIGTSIAIYLSEFAPSTFRETIKPLLEILSAVPTVVYGYFALLFVTPILQYFIPSLPTFNMLSGGIVIGLMVIPYVSSLAEDAMRAVPASLREASYALGANRFRTAIHVVLPAAMSGVQAAYLLAISRAVGETMIVAIATGMQPNLTIDPRESAATITAFIVQVSLGDLPHGSIAYQSIFAAGMALFLLTLGLNMLGNHIRRKFHEAY